MADSAPNASSRAWLKDVIKPLRPIFREVLVISLFVNLLALAVPVFTMQVYDRVVYHHGLGTLLGLIIGMLLVILFDYVLRQTRSRIMQTVALRVDVAVGKRLFDKLMALPLQTLEAQPGSYWNALFRDVDVVRNTLSGASAILIADLPFTFFFVGLIMVIALPIAWVLLVMIPIFMLVAWRSAKATTSASGEERKTTMSRDALISEIVDGRTTIKALALDRSMRPLWEERHADNIEMALRRGSQTDSYSNLGASLAMLTPVFLTCIGAVAIIEQALTMGGLVATNMLSGRILGPMNQLVGQWRAYASFRQSVERLGMIFGAESERLVSEVKLERPKGEITIENVSFSYYPEGRPVVDRVSLTIPPRGVVSIVGRNGSGKTTLLKLMLGLYKPSDGRVLLDGADMGQFTRSELADWIGYVPQDCVLFDGSVKSNICHRHADTTDDQIVAAATAAGVHHFIIDLPDGYATGIGEAGRRLSGGQRQRIAIARALLGNPAVLLFDEPSSSLDRQAEQELRNTIVELGKTRTVVLVTHSPILLGASDLLIALDKGKVALNGPAKEILPKLFGPSRRPAHTADKEDEGKEPAGAVPQKSQAPTAPGLKAPASPPAAAKPGAIPEKLPPAAQTKPIPAPVAAKPSPAAVKPIAPAAERPQAAPIALPLGIPVQVPAGRRPEQPERRAPAESPVATASPSPPPAPPAWPQGGPMPPPGLWAWPWAQPWMMPGYYPPQDPASAGQRGAWPAGPVPPWPVPGYPPYAGGPWPQGPYPSPAAEPPAAPPQQPAAVAAAPARPASPQSTPTPASQPMRAAGPERREQAKAPVAAGGPAEPAARPRPVAVPPPIASGPPRTPTPGPRVRTRVTTDAPAAEEKTGARPIPFPQAVPPATLIPVQETAPVRTTAALSRIRTRVTTNRTAAGVGAQQHSALRSAVTPPALHPSVETTAATALVDERRHREAPAVTTGGGDSNLLDLETQRRNLRNE